MLILVIFPFSYQEINKRWLVLLSVFIVSQVLLLLLQIEENNRLNLNKNSKGYKSLIKLVQEKTKNLMANVIEKLNQSL